MLGPSPNFFIIPKSKIKNKEIAKKGGLQESIAGHG
jgi:hypothetical protein